MTISAAGSTGRSPDENLTLTRRGSGYGSERRAPASLVQTHVSYEFALLPVFDRVDDVGGELPDDERDLVSRPGAAPLQCVHVRPDQLADEVANGSGRFKPDPEAGTDCAR